MARRWGFRLHTVIFVLAMTAAALMLSVLMRPLLEPGFLPFFLAAVVLSAWFHGPVGGYSATFVSSILLIYFFLIPDLALNSATANNLIRLVIFIAVSLLITWLTSAWRTSDGMLKATLSSTGDAVMATDREGRITFLNPVAAELTGGNWPAAKGKPARDVLTLIQERTAEPVNNAIDRVLSEQAVIKNERHVLLVAKEGHPVPIEQSAAPIRDRDGGLRGAILVFRDITERRQIEEQTSQTRKMDAVGRLAGSVAGDFNNVLTVITGYSELLQAELPASSPLRRFAEEIAWGAERAAGLTGQLLAFSRGSSALPRRLDLNNLIGGMEAMLRRLLGETIEFIFLPGPGLGRVDADPPQIEQVIMNLMTNSKEAMAKGGKVVIETSNVDLREPVNSQRVGVKPGEYVMVAVSDTGIGMNAEIRTQLFEPFFTTKDRGKGSGLGLSMVYGILRQYEGHITVYSQPGCGTIFEMYLPVAQEQGVLPRKRERSPKGSETILLVDDEEGVLKLVSAILQSNGYGVIEASNGMTALSAYEKNAHKIDMLLSDVVMPQMNGFQLGEELSQKKPDLKILYMSGYRDSPIGAPPGQANRALLHKPFTPDSLLAKVREVLDARVSQRGESC